MKDATHRVTTYERKDGSEWQTLFQLNPSIEAIWGIPEDEWDNYTAIKHEYYDASSIEETEQITLNNVDEGKYLGEKVI